MPVYRCPDFHYGRTGELTRVSARGPRGPKTQPHDRTLSFWLPCPPIDVQSPPQRDRRGEEGRPGMHNGRTVAPEAI